MVTPVLFKGEPVSIGVYNALIYLDPLYQARFGYELYATDGLRTMEDQWKAWDARQAYLQGRGPFAPVAAYPDPDAPHIAGYGVDLRDSAPNKTLTVIGSLWNEWLHQAGKAVNLTNVGRTFGEGWHFEVPRGTQWLGSPASVGSKPFTPAPAPVVYKPLWMQEEEEEEIMFLVGITDDQGKLFAKGSTVWAVTDGIPGSGVWIEVIDQNTANGYARRFGDYIPQSYASWESLKASVLGPRYNEEAVPGK